MSCSGKWRTGWRESIGAASNHCCGAGIEHQSLGKPRPGLSTGSVNEAILSGNHCTDWYPVQRGSSDGEIRKQIPTSSGRSPGRPSPRDIGMSQWPWARLERRAVCAERCPYGSGRRSAYALLTPFPTWAGFLYLAVVLDACSRRIVGWSMATTLATRLVLDALNMALAMRRPKGVIHHSDQGSQYSGYGTPVQLARGRSAFLGTSRYILPMCG